MNGEKLTLLFFVQCLVLGLGASPAQADGTVDGVVLSHFSGGPQAIRQTGPRLPSPVPNIEVSASNGGRVVGRTKTDVNGHFRLQLPKGSYTLSVPLGGKPNTGQSVYTGVSGGRATVTVLDGKTTKATVETFVTGI